MELAALAGPFDFQDAPPPAGRPPGASPAFGEPPSAEALHDVDDSRDGRRARRRFPAGGRGAAAVRMGPLERHRRGLVRPRHVRRRSGQDLALHHLERRLAGDLRGVHRAGAHGGPVLQPGPRHLVHGRHVRRDHGRRLGVRLLVPGPHGGRPRRGGRPADPAQSPRGHARAAPGPRQHPDTSRSRRLERTRRSAGATTTRSTRRTSSPRASSGASAASPVSSGSS